MKEEGRVRARLPRALAVLGVILFVGLLAYGLLTKGPDTAIDGALAEGRAPQAPSFELAVLERGRLPQPLAARVAPALANGELALEELRGTPTVLNFWASWCVPCREEAPVLQAAWERWGGRGVLLLGLDMQDLTSDARRFLSEFGITYPTIRDPGKDVADSYGATGIPETYFLTGQGRVVSHVIGVVSAVQLEAGIEAALRGRPLGAEEGGARRSPR